MSAHAASALPSALPHSAAETHALIIERFGPFLYHGSAATPAQALAWLAEGLKPQNGADYVWLGSREVAGGYADERCSGRAGAQPTVFQIDLQLIAPERLRADEQLGFHDHYKRLAGASPFAGPPEDEEEWRYSIYEQVHDEMERDPEYAARPEHVWRSYAETGNLAVEGAIPAAALSLAD